jgi:hypothetical protein
MSIFSKIQRSRKAAKEHKGKQAETQRAQAESVPYRHVPTHAAIDAINLAPASWRKHDKVRIVEENRRRSALMSAGAGSNVPAGFLHPSTTALPRVHSALAYTVYPSSSGNSTPPTQLPRPASHAGHIPSNADQAGAASLALKLRSMGAKGKKVDGLNSSPKAAQSFPDSALASTTQSVDLSDSQSDFEMRPLQPLPPFRYEVSAST